MWSYTSRSSDLILNIRESEGLSECGSEAKEGWVESNCNRRFVVASGASVEMYMADLARPWGPGGRRFENLVV